MNTALWTVQGLWDAPFGVTRSSGKKRLKNKSKE
jgi:hypothetical protein